MKSILEYITESKPNKLDLITKYLDRYTVEGGELIGNSANRRYSYFVVCKNKSDVKDICTAIWSIIAEWQGKDKPEEGCIKYMTAMWEAAFSKGVKQVKIPFELFVDQSEEYGVR